MILFLFESLELAKGWCSHYVVTTKDGERWNEIIDEQGERVKHSITDGISNSENTSQIFSNQ